MGIFALIAFFAIIFILIRKNSNGLMEHSNRNSYTLVSSAALCGIIAMMVQGLTDYVWYNYRVMLLFWIFIGIGLGCRRVLNDKNNTHNK